jgi:integrase
LDKSNRRAAKLHLLSAREVLNASDGDHGDGGGLLLRVRAAGASAAWVFRYTSPTGRRREMGLGAAYRSNAGQAGQSLTAARDLAYKARELLRDAIDPIDARDGAKAAALEVEQSRKAVAQRARWTLARCARDYHERVIEPTRTGKHGAQWISSLENHVPAALWHKPIDAIEPPELLLALTSIRPHERARNMPDGARLAETVQRLRQRLDAVFEDGIFYKRCSANPAAAIRRKLREAMPTMSAGNFAALPYAAAPALMARLRSAPGTAARCLEVALLTAARTSEALFAEWSEFDLDAGVWTVPAGRMKGGEAHTVFLSARAIEVLRGQQGLDLRYVFPSTMTKPGQPARPMSNMAMLAVLDRLGMRDRTTVHGLCRSTFSTWANETGAARPDVIEATLAHSESDKVRAAYNRAQFNDERRALLAAWAEYLSKPAIALAA